MDSSIDASKASALIPADAPQPASQESMKVSLSTSPGENPYTASQ